jgi:hypothetical protein
MPACNQDGTCLWGAATRMCRGVRPWGPGLSRDMRRPWAADQRSSRWTVGQLPEAMAQCKSDICCELQTCTAHGAKGLHFSLFAAGC